ncbi:hypothetical protein AVEN_121144-1 [Araneus ventricosus]|uniref:Uncharacterized protein n=1 Tax=Araneus ventricosus TaxID=182803 RepID=A0A4Y2E113_ARAVE|nr:hypothetical protein AVEN_121144-1 [Araneus ventricosus]
MWEITPQLPLEALRQIFRLVGGVRPDIHCLSTRHHCTIRDNESGHVCNVSNRLWFLKDKTPASKNEKVLSVLSAEFPDKDVQAFNLLVSCG